MATQDDVRRIALSLPATTEALDAEVFFTEPHYDGFPAVLVRLPAIDLDLLREVLTSAWRCQAPKRLIRAFDEAAPGGSSRRGG
jgi:hypothetical protein